MTKPPPEPTDGLTLELETPASDGPDGRRRDQPPERQQAFIPTFDPSKYRFQDEAERPLRRAIVGVALVAMWLFFVLFGALVMGMTGKLGSSLLVGTVLWLMVVVGWAVLVGSRAVVLGDGGFLDGVFFAATGRRQEPPELDEAPAQLQRARGKPRAALALYEQWEEQLPHLARTVFRRAEILELDLREPVAAHALYLEFLTRVDALGEAARQEERELVQLAKARLADLATYDHTPASSRPARTVELSADTEETP